MSKQYEPIFLSQRPTDELIERINAAFETIASDLYANNAPSGPRQFTLELEFNDNDDPDDPNAIALDVYLTAPQESDVPLSYIASEALGNQKKYNGIGFHVSNDDGPITIDGPRLHNPSISPIKKALEVIYTAIDPTQTTSQVTTSPIKEKPTYLGL